MSAAGAGAGEPASGPKSFINSIRNGNAPAVKNHLNKGANPNHNYGLALRVAVMSGNVEVLNLLLERGADISKASKESFLETAVLYSKKNPAAVDIARRIIDEMIAKKLNWHKTAVSGPQAGSPLIFDVAFRGTVPMMELFVEKGADLRITEEVLGHQRNLLKTAMNGNNEPMVKFLVEQGLTLPPEEEESLANWMRKKAEVNREVLKGGRKKTRKSKKSSRKSRQRHP